MNDDRVNKYIDTIEVHFNFLFEHGFRIVHTFYDAEHFGNWVVVLSSQEFSFSFIQDRSYISMGIGSIRKRFEFKKLSWLSLEALIYFLTDEKEYIRPYNGDHRDYSKQLQELAEITRKYYDQITNFMMNRFDIDYYTVRGLTEKINDLNLQELRERKNKKI
ncbi:MAG: hypothetical protein WBW94_06800 [Anaerolineales bacterium]